MTRQEKENYRTKTACAVWCDGLTGVECLDVCYGINDFLVVRGYNGDVHTLKINDTTTGRNYIRLYGRRYYLDECLRV